MFYNFFYHIILACICIFPIIECSARSSNPSGKKPAVEFAIFINAHNCESFCKKNLESVLKQAYGYDLFTIYCVNDGSTDGTKEAIDQVMKLWNSPKNCKIIHNPTEKGFLENLYNTVTKLSSSKVVVVMNGEDWLAHPHVLSTIASFYQSKDIWLTYGNYQSFPHGYPSPAKEFSPIVMKKGAYRYSEWLSMPLQTFYVKLFQLIRKEDLQLLSDEFFTRAVDAAYMIPMLEIATAKHIQFIHSPLYVCNMLESDKRKRIEGDLNTEEGKYLRSKTPYAPMPSLFYLVPLQQY